MIPSCQDQREEGREVDRLDHAKPGDVVMLCHQNHGPRAVVVEKVGKKWIKVKGDRGLFSRLDGSMRGDFSWSWITTVAAEKLRREVADARQWLRDRGVTVDREVASETFLRIRVALGEVLS
jgi:hypothetical protein